MVQEGDTNSTLFIGWCLSRSKDNNTGSELKIGNGHHTEPLIDRDYQIYSNVIYDVNVDNNNTLSSFTYRFCIEYLDE